MRSVSEDLAAGLGRQYSPYPTSKAVGLIIKALDGLFGLISET